MTQACGNVLDKWDQVWRQKEGDLINTYREMGHDGSAYTDILPCSLPVAPAGEEGCFDNQVCGSD